MTITFNHSVSIISMACAVLFLAGCASTDSNIKVLNSNSGSASAQQIAINNLQNKLLDGSISIKQRTALLRDLTRSTNQKAVSAILLDIINTPTPVRIIRSGGPVSISMTTINVPDQLKVFYPNGTITDTKIVDYGYYTYSFRSPIHETAIATLTQIDPSICQTILAINDTCVSIYAQYIVGLIRGNPTEDQFQSMGVDRVELMDRIRNFPDPNMDRTRNFPDPNNDLTFIPLFDYGYYLDIVKKLDIFSLDKLKSKFGVDFGNNQKKWTQWINLMSKEYKQEAWAKQEKQ